MREIKFRVWDIVDLKYHYHDSFYESWYSVRLDGSVVDGNGCPYDESHIIQQYTGLKDKSGKEVYDGDILRIKYCVGDFAWEWMSDEDVIKNSEMNGKEYIVIVTSSLIDGVNMQLQGKHDAGLISFPLSYIIRGVVMGNIFENPELIKIKL